MGLIGYYAGSFDPFTNGHLQIVKKAARCFDKVIIGIGHNKDKSRGLSFDSFWIVFAAEEKVLLLSIPGKPNLSALLNLFLLENI